MSEYICRDPEGNISGFTQTPNGEPWDDSLQECIDYLALKLNPNATGCSKLQMLEELASLDLEDALFTALESDISTKRRWGAATLLDINHPLVISMSAVLNFNEAEMQEVFNNASKR